MLRLLETGINEAYISMLINLIYLICDSFQNIIRLSRISFLYERLRLKTARDESVEILYVSLFQLHCVRFEGSDYSYIPLGPESRDVIVTLILPSLNELLDTFLSMRLIVG